MTLMRSLRAGLLLGLASAAAAAAPAAPSADPGVELVGPQAAAIYARIHAARSDMPIAAIRPAEAPGLYTVELGDSTAYYATADGSHLIAGDLYSVGPQGFDNRTEDLRAAKRVGMLDEVSTSDMIVFPAQGETRGVINVFTDVDCGFCRRLHREVPALNAMGVEVRYLAYPRAGLDSRSAQKLVWAWCAKDRQTALTREKNDQPIEQRSCANPVAAEYRLGQRMGVRGTPAIFLADGTMLPGYMPAHALVAAMGLSVPGADAAAGGG